MRQLQQLVPHCTKRDILLIFDEVITRFGRVGAWNDVFPSPNDRVCSSGHPLAMAAGLVPLEVYAKHELFARSRSLEGYWEDALHSLKGQPGFIDIRNIGLMGAVEFEPIPGHHTRRDNDVFDTCFCEDYWCGTRAPSSPSRRP